MTTELAFEYVIRLRGDIYVTNARGERRAAAAWVGAGGRARRLVGARVTDAYELPVGVVVCVQDPKMDEPWCLVASEATVPTRVLIRYYGKRWGIEAGFRDIKDMRFGMGLSSMHVSRPDRRDRLLLISALAIAVLSLLGAAGERIGYNRWLKANTVKRRTHSLFRQGLMLYHHLPNWPGVRLFFVEEFLPYSWAFLPADASLQCSFRGDSNQVSAYPRLSGGQPSLETVPNTRRSVPLRRAPFWTFTRLSGTVPWEGRQACDGCDERIPATYIRRAANRRPLHRSPEPSPVRSGRCCLRGCQSPPLVQRSRQMSESELERELHRRGQDLVRKLLQGHRDQRSPKEAAGPAEDTSGVECSEPHEHESHAETTSGTMQVVGLGCARRGHDGLHRLDAALNLLPERYLVEMGRRVTIATASRAPPCTPWKPPWYSTSSTWQRRRGVRSSSSAHRRACRHLVRGPMGVGRRTVTLGCSCGGSQPPQAAGALMRTETSHEAREDQRKSPIGR